MPNGSAPKYKYRPPAGQKIAHLRTCSSRRSRLWEGGTYFRSRDTGLRSNNISIEVLEESLTEGYCIMTNANIKYSENVVGNAVVDLLELNGTYQDLWVIDQLDTPTPHIKYYSISCQIRFQIQSGLPYTLPAPVDLGVFEFGKVFSDQGKMSVKMSKKPIGYTSIDRIFIAPRTRIHQLSTITKTLGTPPTTTIESGWDIDALRLDVNSTDPWVEMVKRTYNSLTPGSPPIKDPDPADVQDDDHDSDFLTPFLMSRMATGDGLPGNPTSETTGPERSLVHLNYSELGNGELGVHNVVYEWVGDNAISGAWLPY